jgi:DHA2 family multidrug resistance protein-like MFS transporter
MTTSRLPTRAGRREWIGLAVLTLACLLYAMDLTVLHLAVPSLSKTLQPTSTELLWIVDIYGFMVAGALLTMGTLGDRIGRRRLLLIGAAAFSIISVAAAFSSIPNQLIASRALMGLAGATIAPATLSLIFNMFPDPKQRSTAVGIWITAFSAGGAVGPVIGGLLLERYWWGSVFLMALPVMALLLFLGPRVLPEYRDPDAGKLDLTSAAMSLAAVLAVVLGLKELAIEGVSWKPLVSLLVGVAVAVAFWRRQRRLDDPLIDVSMFRSKVFNVALMTNLFGIFVAFGFFLFVAQYLQLVLGLSPQVAGLWSLPSALGFIIGANLSPRFIHKVRPATILAPALGICAVGLWIFTQAGPANGLGFAVAGSIVITLALSPLFNLTTELIVGSAPPEKAGAASGISETGAELGGALGIAILGSLGTAVYRTSLESNLPPGLSSVDTAGALESLGGALEIASDLPSSTGAALVEAGQQAFVTGLHVTTVVTALVAIVVAGVVGAMLRGVPARDGSYSPSSDIEKQRKEVAE